MRAGAGQEKAAGQGAREAVCLWHTTSVQRRHAAFSCPARRVISAKGRPQRCKCSPGRDPGCALRLAGAPLPSHASPHLALTGPREADDVGAYRPSGKKGTRRPCPERRRRAGDRRFSDERWSQASQTIACPGSTGTVADRRTAQRVRSAAPSGTASALAAAPRYPGYPPETSPSDLSERSTPKSPMRNPPPPIQAFQKVRLAQMMSGSHDVLPRRLRLYCSPRPNGTLPAVVVPDFMTNTAPMSTSRSSASSPQTLFNGKEQ